MASPHAPAFRGLPLRGRLYLVGNVALAAAAITAASLALDTEQWEPGLLLVLVGLCAAAGLLEVFAPGHY